MEPVFPLQRSDSKILGQPVVTIRYCIVVEELGTNIADHIRAEYLAWLVVPVIVVAGHFVIRVTDKHVARFFDRVEYDRTLEILIQKTIRVFLWIVVLILALANAGFDVSGFIAGLGVMGFIVGFAVKDVLSNLAAGVFLLVPGRSESEKSSTWPESRERSRR